MLLLLFIVAWCIGHCVSQCPPCNCLQENSRVSCLGGGFTEVPSFNESIQQNVTELDLRNNLITSINATSFQGLSNLRNLNLGFNRISFIEEGSFSSNTALETLQLNVNQLQELDQAVFIELNLRELNLGSNPISCDCNLRWFPDFRGSIRITGNCDAPAHLNGIDLDTVTQDQLLCDCMPSCVNGTCNMTVGECECDDGYNIGSICDASCPVGMFGAGCSQNCTCLSERESSPCDGVNGTCNCLPGYTGPSCEQACPDGMFGMDCLGRCSCITGRVGSPSCSNTNGTCICLPGYLGDNCERDEGDGTVTTLTEATLPAKQAVIPNYGIALLTIGAVLIIVILIAAICTVAVGISAMKRTHRNKILPEFL